MSTLNSNTLSPADEDWPDRLTQRFGQSTPVLRRSGPLEFLSGRKTALFCSARTPGDAILLAHDAARRMRDDGITVISGFHSPIEKECLGILLRGKQPIIICPARAIETMRLPTECRVAFEAGRVLFLSPFTDRPTRVSRESAMRRNEIVAALADEAYIAHISKGAETDRIAQFLHRWGVPVTSGRLERLLTTVETHPAES